MDAAMYRSRCLTEAWSDNMKLLAVLSLALLGVVMADPSYGYGGYGHGRSYVQVSRGYGHHGYGGYGHHGYGGYGNHGYYGKRSAEAEPSYGYGHGYGHGGYG